VCITLKQPHRKKGCFIGHRTKPKLKQHELNVHNLEPATSQKRGSADVPQYSRVCLVVSMSIAHLPSISQVSLCVFWVVDYGGGWGAFWVSAFIILCHADVTCESRNFRSCSFFLGNVGRQTTVYWVCCTPKFWRLRGFIANKYHDIAMPRLCQLGRKYWLCPTTYHIHTDPCAWCTYPHTAHNVYTVRNAQSANRTCFRY
jgi:hypothetical protein